MLKLRSSSRSRPEPLFIAAADHEKPFFERNFTKYFGEETTWEEAIHGETGDRGFIVFAKLSKKTKSDLVVRLREAARTASYGVTHSPSPRLSPRIYTQNTPNLSPLPSPRHLSPLPSPRPTVNTTSPLPSPRVSNFSPLPSPRYVAPPPSIPREPPQRPQLRIQKPDDEPIYEPQLLQCGGLSPHHDAFNSHSPTSRTSNNLSSPIQARQTRSMPSSPVGYTYPLPSLPSASASASVQHHHHHQQEQQQQIPRHPPGRAHQHSQSAHLSARDISGIIDVTNFWDPTSLETFPISPRPQKSPLHRFTNSDTTTAGIRPVIESGLGIEEFYDIYATTIAEEEAHLAEQERRERRKRELEQQGREEAEEAEDVVVRMSANFMGQEIVPDLMIQRRDTEEWRIRPPPKTRRELLRLGWVREKGDFRG